MWVHEECQSIDLAPIHWEKGKLELDGNWQTYDGYHALWCLLFFDANRLWPIALFNLEAVSEIEFGNCDLPA